MTVTRAQWSDVHVAGFEEVIERLRRDSAFADAVHLDPAEALREYQLDAGDLLRIARIVDPASYPSPGLFRAPVDDPPAPPLT